ncbi:MAG: TIGR02186 family protein [Methyloceanibacter sp.]
MRHVLTFLFASLLLSLGLTAAAEEPRPEVVQSDISMREISIQSNFTGVEIVLFGSIDFSKAPAPDEKPYDVIMVVRGPDRPLVVRRKERIAGLWMNGDSKTFSAVPDFYAVLASRPFRAIASEETLKPLGIGFANLDYGKTVEGDNTDDEFRANLIRLQQERRLFQESDDAIGFIGRSLFRGSVDLPVNVPIGRYTTQVFLFRDGKLLSQSQSSLQVHKVGLERVVYMLAYRYPLTYGLLAVLIAMSAGLLAWTAFRRE